MSDQNQVSEEKPFFFKLVADEKGVTSIEFKKDMDKVMSAIFTGLAVINRNFVEPFPTLGDFLRNLGDIADQMEAEHGSKTNANSKPAAEELSATQEGGGVRPADIPIRSDSDQG